jgi:hypothetical protein
LLAPVITCQLGFVHVGTMLCNQCEESVNGPPDNLKVDNVVETILQVALSAFNDHLKYCEFFASPEGTLGCNTPDVTSCTYRTSCNQCGPARCGSK